MEQKQNQETMDESPARVTKSLGNLVAEGKFAGQTINEAMLDTARPVIDIWFQAGPIQVNGVNGCSIEDVIDVLVTRLNGFQAGPFRCRENAIAIANLEQAKLWLLERTRKRQVQGVEGTNAPHAG